MSKAYTKENIAAQHEAAKRARGVKRDKPPVPHIESPTWGDVHSMAASVLAQLGGPKGAADKLSWREFYALSILASLNLSPEKAGAFLLGKQYLT